VKAGAFKGRTLLAIVACLLAGCGEGQKERAPSASDDRLVVMGLKTLGRATSLDPGTGEVIAERRLRFGCGDALVQFIRSDGRLVFCSDGSTVRSIDPELRERPEAVGHGFYFVPEQDGVVWLIDGSRIARTTVDGELLEEGRVPCVQPLVTEDGPLCRGARNLELIDIETGETVRRIQAGLHAAANGTTVSACREPCTKLVVSDVSTGETTAVRPPDPLEFRASYGAEFSPDGSKLATPVFTEPPAEKRFPYKNRPSGIAVVDLASRDTHLVPNSEPGGYGRIAWTATGDRLYFTGEENGSIYVYDLADGETQRVPFDFKDKIFQLAAF